ncbi:MAG: nitrate/nitrite transporter NrtS [Pseudomonadales bacterium]
MNRLYFRQALWIALIVGTFLNVINQWEACLGQTSFVWFKLVLTYCVPFSVALYSSHMAARNRHSAAK